MWNDGTCPTGPTAGNLVPRSRRVEKKNKKIKFEPSPKKFDLPITNVSLAEKYLICAALVLGKFRDFWARI